MKERFETEEWEAIKALPFHLFGAIALADGEVQKEEFVEFASRMARGAVGYKDLLHREIARDIVDSDASSLTEAMPTKGGFDAQETKQILQDKLTTDEYQGLMCSLFVDLINIAKASKTKRLFRKTIEIDDDEQERLALIGVFWEIDVGRLVQA